MKTALTMMILLCHVFTMSAQHDWEKYYNQIVELEDIESASWESAYDILSDLEEHPININTATREELEQIPFLTDKEIEDICAYTYQYGGMKTLGELAMIESIGYNKRQLLTFFVYAGEKKEKGFPSVGNILKYGRHDVLLTGKVPFYERKGDRNGYLGYQYKHNVRYNFKYGDYVRLGLVGAQDAGEPFFANRNGVGYDFYSFYLLVRKLRRLKVLAVGRYRAGFGMGLVINNDFLPGKIAALSSLGRNSSGIRAHSSTQSGNYLQGAAATVELGRGLDLSVFASYRKIDATINNDTNTIATIVTSGYHRTQAEMRKKNNSSQTLAGGNLRYFRNGFHFGATAVYTALDKPLQPDTGKIYRRYSAEGKDFYNIGINYGYTGSRIVLSGETATGGCHAIATINTLSFRATSALDLLILQRFYSKRYYSLFAQSFSDGGAVQDESGVYAGANWHPSRKLSVMAYTDYAYFAWPRYQALLASHSWDNLLSVAYMQACWTFTCRYRFRMRERNNEEKTGLKYRHEHRGRLSAAYNGKRLSAKTQCDIAYTRHDNSSFGWMLTENVTLIPLRFLKLNAGAGYFHTKNYDSRVYTYEQGMLYSFNFPSFYGEGIRYSFLVRSDICRSLMLMAKLSVTDYFDRNKIGTGYQQIDRSSMTELDLQLRWRF